MTNDRTSSSGSSTMIRYVSFHAGFNSSTTTELFAGARRPFATPTVTYGSLVPSLLAFLSFFARTRVISRTAAAPSFMRPPPDSPSASAFFAIGTRIDCGHTMTRVSALPMTFVIASLKPGIMSMFPPTRDSANRMSGFSTKDIPSRWNVGMRSSKSESCSRSVPANCNKRTSGWS